MLPQRPTLVSLSPAVHGARDYAELARLGLAPDDILDFSTNSNPYGPAKSVLAAVRRVVSGPGLSRYPDRDCLTLCAAIAAAENVPDANVLPGNGAAELIQLIALAFVLPGSRHLVLAPTFGEYSRAIRLAGGVVQEVRPPAGGPDLYLNVEAAAAAIRELQPDGVWLCNPNNPTGQVWALPELAYLRAAASARPVLWVVDESYRYFTAPPVSLLDAAENWAEDSTTVVIRSLTKEYALAGLRLGYIVAAVPLINTLHKVQPPWSVNSLAQAAGTEALQPAGLAWRQKTLARLQAEAAALWRELAALGQKVLPAAVTYTLVEVGDAVEFRRRLLASGLLVRDCTSFGLPGHVRIAARRPADNQRLVETLAALTKNFPF